jgi:hypothetical protein
LVNCFCKACERGGHLKLVHVQRNLHKLLVLFRLDTILLEGFEWEPLAGAGPAAPRPGTQPPQPTVRTKGATACLSWGQLSSQLLT